MSWAQPAFLRGVARMTFWIVALGSSPGKRIVPGATLFTLTWGASALARQRVNMITAALDEQ